jgi:hypothetical protein
MLIVSAILTGILTALVIRCTTRPQALREVRNRIYAHLLEFRLFFDEPALIWQAQLNLVRDNLVLVRLLLPSALILALPMTWLFLQLDAIYGHRPLRPGEPAILTAQLTRPIAAADRFSLSGAGNYKVETPPIRVFHDDQIVWRIRAMSEAPGDLLPRVPEGDLAWVKIDYPKATGAIPPMVWFLAISTATALLTTRGLRLR